MQLVATLSLGSLHMGLIEGIQHGTRKTANIHFTPCFFTVEFLINHSSKLFPHCHQGKEPSLLVASLD